MAFPASALLCGLALLGALAAADVAVRAGTARTGLAAAWSPAAGLAYALLVLGGPRWALPLVAVHTALLLWVPLGSAPLPPAAALAHGAAAVAFYGTAAWAARRKLPEPGVPWDLRDTLYFSALALLAPLPLALLGAAGLLPAAAAQPPLPGSPLLRAWTGEAIGLVLVVPFLWHFMVAACHALRGCPIPGARSNAREARGQEALARRGRDLPRLPWLGPAALLLGCAATGALAGRTFTLAYLCFLPLIGLALLRGVRGAALAILAVNLGMGVSAAVAHPAALSLLPLQFLLLTLSLAGLLLGAVVSDQRRAVARQLRSEAHLRNLLETCDEGVLTLDREGTVTLANARMQELLGPSPQSLVGRSLYEFMTPEQVPEAAAYLARRLQGVRETYDLELRHAQGHPVWVRVHASPIREGDGAVRGVLALLSDLSEQREAERRRRHSERLLSTALKASRDSVALFRRDDERLLAVNPAWVRITGHREEEALGRTHAQLGIWADPADAQRFGELMRAHGHVRDFEFHLLRKDGTRRLVEVYAEALEVDGEAFVLGIGRDITEARALESQRRQLQTFEDLGRLAGGVAHDFNNLLSVIATYTQLTVDSMTAGDTRRADLEEVLRASERAGALTGQLLAFSRARPAERRPLQLNDVVNGLAGLLRPLLGRNVPLDTQLAAELPLVLADRGQVEQVLLNVALNARDAMPEGGRLTLTTAPGPTLEREGHPQAHVLLTVQDAGSGMDEATRTRVFEPFFTTKAPGQGTGLGLSIVHSLVHQAGGWVELESAPGQGTCVRLFWPVAAQAQLQAPGPPDALAPAPAQASGRLRVLLAEDEPSLRLGMRRVLEELGCEVTEAPDGIEALAALVHHDEAYDLLLSDAVMPRMGGRTLAERARAHDPGLQVLFVCGYTDSSGPLAALATAPPYVLHKPFSPEALRRAIASVPSRASQPPAAFSAAPL